MNRRLIRVVLLLAIIPSYVSAQEPTAQISPGEAREAERIARSFTGRLEETKDLTPLINEFFAPDFIGGYLNDTKTNRFLLLKRDIARRVTRDELLRYFVVTLNAAYLNTVYIHSKYPSTSNRAVPEEKLFPVNVARFLKSHSYATSYRDKDLIESVEQLRSYLDLWEKAGALLREYVLRNHAEKSKGYRATLADWEERFNQYKPWLRDCGESCFGLPNVTKVITVNVPVFQLELALINGEMKIVSATYYFK